MAHSTLSPSGAHRWLSCTPSAMLERQFPDSGSEAAEEGTLAHELAELKLRNYFQTVEFGKTKFTRAVNKLKKNPLWADEMQGYTDVYLDYVKTVAMKFENIPSVAIEKPVSLDKYVPHLPDEDPAGGTADCILIGGGVLHIIDFKYGKGVPVSAEGNPQLSLYALGAYEAYKILYPIERIELHIVQPRLSEEPSNWGCPLTELLAFGEWVKQRAALAIQGEGEFRPTKDNCRFCRARGTCRARAEKNVELAFGPIGKKPPVISNEEMGEFLKLGEDVAKWLADLQDCALAQCLAGKDVPGWKAVEGRGSREWSDLDTAFGGLEAAGVEMELLWERKPLSVAQAEKVIGKKEFEALAKDYVVKKPGKPALVKDSDKRPAITNKITAEEAFKEENGWTKESGADLN